MKISLWKIVLIAMIFLFSLLYLLPTPGSVYGPFYGYLEVWMQRLIHPPTLVGADSTIKFDLSSVKLPEGIDFQETYDKLRKIIRDQLTTNGIAQSEYIIDTTEKKEIYLKFTSPKSESELRRIYNELQLYGKIPPWLRPLFSDRRLKLGLDLKGGVHLVLEVDPEEVAKKQMEEARRSILERMRDERVFCKSVDQLGKDTLMATIDLPKRFQEPTEKSRYLKKAEEVLKNLGFFDSPQKTEFFAQNQIKYTLKLSEKGIKKYSEDSIERVLEVIRNRVDAFGVSEPQIRREPGQPRIRIQLPGARDSSEALAVVKTMGKLEFRVVKNDLQSGAPIRGDANTPAPDNIPTDSEVKYDRDGSWYVLEKNAALTGDRLKSAAVRQDNFGKLMVGLDFDSEGRKRFGEVTGAHVNDLLAIVLDDKVQSAPVIRQKITESAVIEGDYTVDEANYLANILRAGAFPVATRVAEERTVGPALGQEAIESGIIAAIIGSALVIGFIVVYYKLSGLIAVAALIFNIIVLLAVMAGFGATLSLPGLAGLALTVGMAVDANVLIFERIREEIRSGKTIRAAIDSGYQRVFWTIFDSNLTTLLTALVLFQFGTGPIKGFAVTLSTGLIASMFTALVVTREMYNWIYRNKPIKRLSI